MKKLTIFAAALLFSVAAFAQEEDNSIVLRNFDLNETIYNLTYESMYGIYDSSVFVKNNQGYWEQTYSQGYVFGQNNRKTQWVGEVFSAPKKMQFDAALVAVAIAKTQVENSTVTFFLTDGQVNILAQQSYKLSMIEPGVFPVVFYETDEGGQYVEDPENPGQYKVKEITFNKDDVFMVGYTIDYTNPGDTFVVGNLYRTTDDAVVAHPTTVYMKDSYFYTDQETGDTLQDYEVIRWEYKVPNTPRSVSMYIQVMGTELEEEPEAIANVEAINVAVYPNPASEELRIENAENANVRIFNLLGKEVYRNDRAANLERVNVKDFAKGTYFVRIEKEGKVASQKVLIAR